MRNATATTSAPPRSWRRALPRLVEGQMALPGRSSVDIAEHTNMFGPAVVAIRWATLAVSLVLGVERLVVGDLVASFLCALLTAYAGYRTQYPHRHVSGSHGVLLILFEVAIHSAAVVATGYWSSPLVFSLATAIAITGVSRGLGFALAATMICSLTISIADAAGAYSTERIRDAIQWAVILSVIAAIASYTRRLTGEADRQHNLAMQRLGRLADANALLFSLHRITQTLPASLDLNEVLDTTVTRLRGLFDYQAMSILIFDETDSQWQVVRKEHTVLPTRLGPTDLPAPLRRAVAQSRLISVSDLAPPSGPGTSPRFGSGLYSALSARGQIIGLLSIEHDQPHHFTERDVDLLNGFVEPVALAIDNARWFGRLRTVGADEERTRIARDLHDRIGQSLAYLAFELDRLSASETRGENIGPDLSSLRTDVRSVITEVRDTLYDLRTDVSDSKDIEQTLAEFIARFSERNDLPITMTASATCRLPILQERELWRIAQEALVNVNRHARATTASVSWKCGPQRAVLEVTDDGIGFPVDHAGRLDSYGILGMRERASSVGASLEIISAPGAGTTIRCELQSED